MSVLVEFAMFPTDKGESVSAYVAQVIDYLSSSGVRYQLTPMGTIFETETMSEALEVIGRAYAVLEPFSNRVYAVAKFDIRKGPLGRMEKKVRSVEEKLEPADR